MKLFDWHCDTLTECMQANASLQNNEFDLDFSRASKLYDRLIQMTAVYIPDTLTENEAWGYTCRALSYLSEQEKQTSSFRIGYPSVETNGCFVLPALENARAIGNDLSRIAVLSECGVVYVTLTWNGQNRLGNGCLSCDQSGLTAFGMRAVNKLFEQGILPDVSHLNEAGFWDVVALADGRPFIASHSVSKSVCDHPRNLTDLQFCAIRDSGGIVGLNLCKSQLGEQSFECFERHLSHFLYLGGEQTVVIGMDLDGTPLPSEWQGVAVACKLYEYLRHRGYDEDVLERVFYKNSTSFFEKTLTSRQECIRIGT